MARPRQTNRLDLWMNGLPVGHWEIVRGVERLAYAESWLEDEQGRPLSLSLPFTPGNQPLRGEIVTDYFDNLLPDSERIRRRIATRYRTGGTTPFELLAVLGRDCVGALQLLPAGEAPVDLEHIEGRPLDEHAIAQLLRDTTATPRAAEHDAVDDLRLSIAGAQEKTALLWHGGEWLLPTGSTPTTHILKLPLGLVGNMRADMRTSVENEWLCARIVAAFGLPIAPCEIAEFEDVKALVVERFDRRLSRDGRWIVRLPQEDLCQATGTPGLLKYEADGGPGIDAVMAVLGGSVRAADDRRHFFLAQMIFWLLAATDGHAKNFSIAHLPGSRYAATPLYDVLSAHPIIGRGRNQLAAQRASLAMAVRGRNAHYRIAQILPRHWIAQGQRVGFTIDQVEEMMATVVAQTERVIDEVGAQLPREFPVDVADAVFEGMRRLARVLGTG
ncbi:MULTISPECIES: type II toxin-antitoxin system HipA family toxin [Paraburkholderia]|uniref:Serine/threonine-protein kinase HipA n=1 Tax=Paraburkholderia tropica TaxID=92647 RepID=A0A1A5X0M3_9BURK|nr:MULTISPECIES: type II toxin-antitoxin system HipA family toxin [Paraburkholderia]MBB2981011.1 serine/threonine-protein kinase HipA [Paraburkholderia tropica]MBB3002170.1 serine/threonine-protein kinase HipA [Paraburkholderia tropica]MBB6321553.1 serine/threonine-protein kinase HipA [Paraburkholderia tropica]MDE1138669.1 type II toxin-antitoxin system HipA family toxin [Paraburkholderia tropica]OBR46690.1 toxin HipA [Paraburkholderia tropica]